jgi:hypothetical protein
MTTVSPDVQGQVRHKTVLQDYTLCLVSTPEMTAKRRQVGWADAAVIKATCWKIFIETVTCVVCAYTTLRRIYLPQHEREREREKSENTSKEDSKRDEAPSWRKIITQTLFGWWNRKLGNKLLYTDVFSSEESYHCFTQHVTLDDKYGSAAFAATTVFCEPGSIPLK